MPLKIISITVTEDENTKLLLEIIAEYYYAPLKHLIFPNLVTRLMKKMILEGNNLKILQLQ